LTPNCKFFLPGNVSHKRKAIINAVKGRDQKLNQPSLKICLTWGSQCPKDEHYIMWTKKTTVPMRIKCSKRQYGIQHEQLLLSSIFLNSSFQKAISSSLNKEEPLGFRQLHKYWIRTLRRFPLLILLIKMDEKVPREFFMFLNKRVGGGGAGGTEVMERVFGAVSLKEENGIYFLACIPIAHLSLG
jgi:hypothetical protein